MKRILIFILLFAAAGTVAQERFDYVERRNPWSQSPNAAGLRQDSLSRSYAEVYFTKENGGMTGHSSSDNSWNAGARTASIRHFEKVSFAGSFGYDYSEGRNMCGSMFVEPGYYPFDLLEFTPGRKVRESYAFTGGVSAVLGRRWMGGVAIDFEARNYAKRKDLRHKNTRLDFEFAPGVMYHAGPLAVGINYIIGKNSEKLEAEQIATTPEPPKAFLDKGLYYGVLRQWDSDDLHLASASGVSGFPVKENTQGAGLQLQYGAFYGDIAYRNRQGETGERGVIWYEFETSQITANAVWSLHKTDTEHFVRTGVDWVSQKNRENIITFNNENGVSLPQIHGSVPIFSRRRLDLRLEYEIATARMRTRAGVEGTWLNRESTLMYPYVEGQKTNWVTVFGDCLLIFGRWELNFAADYRQGSFSERSEKFETPGEPGEYPEQLTDYYDYENEYLTAKRLGAALGLRYNISRFYIDLNARYEHGFGLKYVAQPNRVAATLSIGYIF
ncbi:DUF6850 family outer membrane beta-barrel protein [uncultured Alistipes sp.]|jgi:hypothetical protein|uniref:DUF6850 family outer membrane beta-barrel protein n=1 Tax=uncultured Alistipes sp. TaxID=538949 RepID=UPI0025D9D6E8|nr:DUF6850 family outer membrane beta-barrel protein [uncultured Alistipes sp.]